MGERREAGMSPVEENKVLPALVALASCLAVECMAIRYARASVPCRVVVVENLSK